MEFRLRATWGPSAAYDRNPVDEAGFRSSAAINTSDDLIDGGRRRKTEEDGGKTEEDECINLK